MELSGVDLPVLSRILAGDDAERALEGAVAHLGRCGLVAEGPSHAPPDVEASHGETTLRLWHSHRSAADDGEGADRVDEVTKTALTTLLRVALARRAEQIRHRETKERLDMLSSASFEGIMVHVNGVAIAANTRLAEILRCDEEDLIGSWMFHNCIAPEDKADVQQKVASGFEGAYVITGVRKDGTRFPAELQSKQGRLGQRPVRVAAVRDVTERERTLALLRESEARLRDLAQNVFDVTVFSRDGIIVDARGDVEGLIGMSCGDVIGRRVVDFTAPSATRETAERVAKKQAGRYDAILKHRAGELVPVEIVAINSTLDGMPTRVAGIRDLRGIRREQERRRQLELQVERTQRLESLGVLAGGLAHDFNNLLVGMLGNAELLLLQSSDETTRELARGIFDAAQTAAGLTSQMLAYAGSKSVSKADPVDLAGLVQELRGMLAANLSKKATLGVEAEPGCVVKGDRSRLSQVLMNLLTNASDALDDRAGRIDVHIARTTQPDERWDHALGARISPGEWILCEVRDTGSGMDDATLSRVFEPFFTTKERGHGLGLATSVGIVASHGGAVHVRSEPGAGTCFSLLLPAGREETPQRKVPVLRSAEPCRVLVIDDEPIVRSQLVRSLELRGYQVKEASDGRQGLAAYREGEVDLVILDMKMPGLSGAEVARQLRSSGATAPILVSSAYLDATAEALLGEGVVQELLAKPYGIEDLMNAVAVARAAAAPGKVSAAH